MLAWRLCREPFADLNGHGARQYGGRWNSPGRPLVYAASAAALAVLEVRVHLDLPFELLPEDYLLLTINMGDLPVEELANLPLKAAEYGDTWLRERRTPLLWVPSAIVPETPNILLNPLHPDAQRARVIAQRRFEFDRRLWYSV